MDTLASKISHQTLDRIVAHFALDEVLNDDGGPFLPLVSEKFGNVPVGSFRLWDGGERLLKMVYAGITVEPIGIDSHMVFVFTQPDSPLPTFTLDSVYTRMPPGADPNFPDGGDMYAFHLDLVPRCDLGINHAYINKVYDPLTATQAETLTADGIFEAQLSPTQRAIMSPWMLAQRVTAEAYEATVFPAVDTYLNHWLSLIDEGVDDVEVVGEFGAARDAANRQLIFSREIDPVWSRIDMMLGSDVSDLMIAVLRSQVVESEAAI